MPNNKIESWFPFGGRDSHGEILRDPVINAIAKAHGKSAALNKEKRYFNMTYDQIKAWMGGYELWD